MILRRVLLPTLTAAVLAGCATPAPPVDAPAPEVPVSEVPAPAVALPWPGGDTAELQQRVDDGTQPWLLDPSEVALAYAAAAHGWDTAQVVASSDASTVDVTGPENERRTLTLDRPGPGDIWLVTADTPTP